MKAGLTIWTIVLLARLQLLFLNEAMSARNARHHAAGEAGSESAVASGLDALSDEDASDLDAAGEAGGEAAVASDLVALSDEDLELHHAAGKAGGEVAVASALELHHAAGEAAGEAGGEAGGEAAVASDLDALSDEDASDLDAAGEAAGEAAGKAAGEAAGEAAVASDLDALRLPARLPASMSDDEAAVASDLDAAGEAAGEAAVVFDLDALSDEAADLDAVAMSDHSSVDEAPPGGVHAWRRTRLLSVLEQVPGRNLRRALQHQFDKQKVSGKRPFATSPDPTASGASKLSFERFGPANHRIWTSRLRKGFVEPFPFLRVPLA